MRSIKDGRNNNGNNGGNGDINVNKYDGMNEQQLLGELFKNVAAEKQNGTFSAATLDEFYEFVSPTLDDGSRARLKELIAMIKNQ